MRRSLGFALSAALPVLALPLVAPPELLPRLLENDRGLSLAAFWALFGLSHWRWGVALEDLPPFAAAARALKRFAPSTIVGSLAIGAAGVTSLAAIRRHDAFGTSYDMGVFDQVVWAAAHGHGLASSLQGPVSSMFGMHFMPVLYPVGWLYRLWESPRALLALQAVALTSSVIPAFLLAQRKLGPGLVRWIFAFAFLAYLPVRAMGIWDFHPTALSTPLILWAVWALEEDRSWLFALFLGASCLCKESGFLAAAGLGFYVALFSNRRILGWTVFAVGIAGFVLVTGWVVPHFRHGATDFFVSRYGYLGGGDLGGLLTAPLRHPWRCVRGLFWPPRKLEYLLRLTGPFAFLSLARPRWLVALAPLLAVNLLADYPPMQSMHFQYNAELCALIYAAAVDGAAFLVARGVAERRSLGLAVAICGCAMWGTGEPFETLATLVPARAARIDEALSKIPSEDSLSAQDDLLPHAAHRLDLRLLPDVRGARYVAFDLWASLPSWNTTPDDNRLLLSSLLSQGYERIEGDDGFVLLERKAP